MVINAGKNNKRLRNELCRQQVGLGQPAFGAPPGFSGLMPKTNPYLSSNPAYYAGVVQSPVLCKLFHRYFIHMAKLK